MRIKLLNNKYIVTFLSDRRRGIGLSIGFITSYDQLQHN
jgi:hypothetical protein